MKLVWVIIGFGLLLVLIAIINIINTSKINKITPIFLEKQRSLMGLSSYLKYIKRLNGMVESLIISKAEKGKPRDYELEEKLTLLQKELEKYINNNN